MLSRICLILAIVAGLAVGGLNFVKVKERITTLQANLKEQTDLKDKALADLSSTRKDLKKTSDELAQTKTTLKSTEEARDAAVAAANTQKTRADKLDTDLAKARKDRDDAQADLEAYRLTGLNPQEIVKQKNSYKALEDSLMGAKLENSLLGRRNERLQAELDRFTKPEKPVYLPADLTGKVLISDPKWSFVVLNIGEVQRVKEYGELLVNRNGKLVAKVIVRSLQKDRSIANVMPGWQLSDILEGDQVIPAHPQPPS
jgi:myosin heavy subunit